MLSTKVNKGFLWGILSGLFLIFISTLLISNVGQVFGLAIIVLPFIIMYISVVFKYPNFMGYSILFLSFFLFAINRYIVKDNFPVGTLVDMYVFFMYFVLLTKGLSVSVIWKRTLDAPLFIFLIWFLFCLCQLWNGYAPQGFYTWFNGVRPYLYLLLSVPLFCILLDHKSVNYFIVFWGVCSLILSIKGFVQLNIGLDSVERVLIQGPMRSTHLLWGQLRVFSLCSDAGIFGAIQGVSGIAFAIFFLQARNIKERIFLLLVSLAGVYGMFISGTRGSLFIVLVGAFVYLILVRRFKLLVLGAVCMSCFFVFMRYSDAGSGIYAIRRMRTAFNTEEDASFGARYAKELKVREYVADKPFGCGFGSMDIGLPDAVMPNLGTDSGFVALLGQQGIVGVILYIAMFFSFLLKGTYLVWFKIKNEWLRNILIGFIAGISGLIVAHYANPIMQQHPVSYVIILGVAVIYSASRIDKELTTKNE